MRAVGTFTVGSREGKHASFNLVVYTHSIPRVLCGPVKASTIGWLAQGPVRSACPSVLAVARAATSSGVVSAQVRHASDDFPAGTLEMMRWRCGRFVRARR